jgi:hypothetical protein
MHKDKNLGHSMLGFLIPKPNQRTLSQLQCFALMMGWNCFSETSYLATDANEEFKELMVKGETYKCEGQEWNSSALINGPIGRKHNHSDLKRLFIVSHY